MRNSIASFTILVILTFFSTDVMGDRVHWADPSAIPKSVSGKTKFRISDGGLEIAINYGCSGSAKLLEVKVFRLQDIRLIEFNSEYCNYKRLKDQSGFIDTLKKVLFVPDTPGISKSDEYTLLITAKTLTAQVYSGHLKKLENDGLILEGLEKRLQYADLRSIRIEVVE